MSVLCHKGRCRRSHHDQGRCQHGGTSGCRFHNGFHFSNWLSSHIRYSAATMSRLFVPHMCPSARRVLPTSTTLPASATTSDAADTEVEVESSGSNTYEDEKTDLHDTTVEDFQSEGHDFGHFSTNLPTASFSDIPIHLESLHETSAAGHGEAVVSEWNHLVKDYQIGIESNVLAMKHVRQQDFRTAARIWLQAGKSNSSSAKIHFNAALCYQNGIGLAQSTEKAMECYKKAAKLNHSRSAYNLAVIHLRLVTDAEDDHHYHKACQLLEQAAHLGLREAQRELGVLLMNRRQHSGDAERAVALFEKAAVQKDVDAIYFLGICYERGLGTTRNEAKAAEMYRTAASHHHGSALYNLAVFFEHGIGGIPEDREEAMYLYRQAAARGTTAAVVRLKILSQNPVNNEQEVDTVNGLEASKPTDKANSMSVSSRFFHSLSHGSDMSNESVASDWEWMEEDDSDASLSLYPEKTTFYLEQPLIGPETTPFPHPHYQAVESNLHSSLEFHDLLELVSRPETSSCGSLSLDQVVHHSSLENFVIPQGSFGNTNLRHVSSFG